MLIKIAMSLYLALFICMTAWGLQGIIYVLKEFILKLTKNKEA